MPALVGNRTMAATLDAGMGYASATVTSNTGRNIPTAGRKNAALMIGLAQRSLGARSVANRLGVPNLTLLQQENGRASAMSQPHPNLNKSVSSINVSGGVIMDEKMQRSQLNIDRKMREDFDRLQKQLSKRMEKEKLAQEQIQITIDDRVRGANAMNVKGQVALQKVKKQQRMLEKQSVQKFKANMIEIEERRQKHLQDENGKAARGQKDFIKRERALHALANQNKEMADEAIVHSLYSLEVKLKVGQERSKNWKDENIKGKAENHNRYIDGINGPARTSSVEQIAIEKLNKVVSKQQRMVEFS